MSTQEPLVSVVIPSYNHEDYIEKTILGILKQSYENVELIVIDDCSTDRTFEIVKDLSKKYGFICEQRKRNQGHCVYNLNYGFDKYASGVYFAVCASDDIWLETKLKKQIELMDKNFKIGLSYTKCKYIETSGKEFGSNVSTFDELLYGCPIPSSSIMIRATCFKEIGGYETDQYCEDWDLYLRLSQKFEIHFIDEVLILRALLDTSVAANVPALVEGQNRVLDKWKNYHLYKDAKYRLKNMNYRQLLSSGYFIESLSLVRSLGLSIFEIDCFKVYVGLLVKLFSFGRIK